MDIPTTAARVVRSLDANRNGAVDARDWTVDAALLGRLDSDGDGKVTEAEVIAHLTAAPSREKKRVASAAKKADRAVEDYREARFPDPRKAYVFGTGVLGQAMARNVFQSRLESHGFLRQEAKSRQQTLAGRLARMLDRTPEA